MSNYFHHTNRGEYGQDHQLTQDWQKSTLPKSSPTSSCEKTLPSLKKDKFATSVAYAGKTNSNQYHSNSNKNANDASYDNNPLSKHYLSPNNNRNLERRGAYSDKSKQFISSLQSASHSGKKNSKKSTSGKTYQSSPSGKKRTTNHLKNSKQQQQQQQKNIDINMFEHQVLSFQEIMKNYKEGNLFENELNVTAPCTFVTTLSTSLDTERTFHAFTNAMKSLAMELKNYMIMLIGQKQQKYRGLKIIDRSLYCLVQGIESLDSNWSYYQKQLSLMKNQKQRKDDHKNTSQFSTIKILWNDVLDVIQGVRKSVGNAKKVSLDVGHIQDCFVIIMKHMLNQLNTDNIHSDDSTPSYVKDDIQAKKLEILGKCLLQLIQGFGHELHGENLVSPMVGSIIIPLLEIKYLDNINCVSTKHDRNNINSNDNNGYDVIDQILELQSVAMECIVEILQWKHHSSTILAPLVIDVASSEKDHLCPNPLRLRLLQSMIALLHGEEFIEKDHRIFLCRICESLYSSLDKMYAIECSHKNRKATEKNRLTIDHIEVAGVFKWVHKSLQNPDNFHKLGGHLNSNQKSLRWHCLRLLTSITKLYPQGCAQYWALFFPQTTTSPKKSNSLSVTLLTIISDGVSPPPSNEEKIMAIKAARELISSLPIDLWSQSGYLMNRVETSLSQFILCCYEQLRTAQSNKYIDELCITAKTLITEIPYDVYKALIQPGILLISQVGAKYIQHEKCNDGSLLIAIQVLADCFGGTETPGGELTSLPIPTKCWLRQPSSSSFIEDVFNSILSIDASSLKMKGSAALQKVNLVTRMVRAVSWIVMENENRLKNFVTLSQLLIAAEGKPLKLTGVKLIAAFVEGKRNVGVLPMNNKTGSISMHLIYLSLHQMLQENESIIRCCTLSAYGNLQYSDWLVLLHHDPNPMKLMLPMCLEYSGDSNGNVRSEACRCIGNIVTECLESINSICHDELKSKIFAIVEDTMTVAASAAEDSTPGVRSMALFAMGNIVFAIAKMKDVDKLLEKLPLLSLSEIVFKHLVDENDKVISNAIRTLGHLCNILYKCKFSLRLRSFDSILALKLCGKAASEMGRKIELAITDVTDTLNQRSWRQRSFAKRHAWGACQALSYILYSKVANEDVNQQGVRSALMSMINCIQYSQLLNEKIVFGALSTLTIVPLDIYACHNNPESMSGFALAVCLINLEASEIPSTYKKSVSELIRHLMKVVNHFDIMTCFSHQDLSQSNVQCLYSWMVAKNVGAICYENVAEALQLSKFNADVSLIQKFRSRAEKRRRDEHIFNSYQHIDNTQDDEDEEDEL